MTWSIVSVVIAAAVPTLAALGGPGLWIKLFADRLLERQRAHYSKEMAERQNAYSMGATSHMAIVVFNNHIDFCKEYVQATSDALHALLQEGHDGPNAV